MVKKMVALSFILCFAVVALPLASCSDSGSRETELLRKALFNGDETIEASMNAIAGSEGVVSYYMPEEQPINKTFRSLGVKIQKFNNRGWSDNTIAEYVILVNTTANTSEPESLVFNGYVNVTEDYAHLISCKFIFNGKGDGRGLPAWKLFLSWGGASEFAIEASRSIFDDLRPKYVDLESPPN